jgi:hypothetical protein
VSQLSGMTDRTRDSRASSSSPEPGHKADTNKPIETTEQLRIAIDQGNAKVNATDQAAEPLGTDDEAGETSSTVEQVRLAATHEIHPVNRRQRDTGIGHAGGSLQHHRYRSVGRFFSPAGWCRERRKSRGEEVRNE